VHHSAPVIFIVSQIIPVNAQTLPKTRFNITLQLIPSYSPPKRSIHILDRAFSMHQTPHTFHMIIPIISVIITIYEIPRYVIFRILLLQPPS